MKRLELPAASAIKTLRHGVAQSVERRVDLLAVLALTILTLFASRDLVSGGIMVGKDTITQFYPWYSYLGERLSSGEIPGWNPSQFSGAPFAGDPLSGWAYLPAMLFFTLLPVDAAAAAYLVFHLLIAGLGTYLLARALSMNVAGSMLAAVAYEYTGYLYTRSACCSAYVGVSAWLPLAILGAEMAMRKSRWLDRGLWWGISGLAISQILAAWIGQGSYYALLALGGYMAYRTLISPPPNIRGLRVRILALVLNGGAVLLFGFGLAAAGVLPRLEFHSVSNLAEGYAGIGEAVASYGGWKPKTWVRLMFPGVIYAGLTTLVLALAAPFIARARHAVPYFFLLAVCALILSLQTVTPLHTILYSVLPSFESLHTHGPERVKVVLYLAFALLAGATFSRLGELRTKSGLLALAPILLAALFLVTRAETEPLQGRAPHVLAKALGQFEEPFPANLGIALPSTTMVALIFALVCVAAYALLPTVRPVTGALVVLVVFVDLFAAGSSVLDSRAADDGTEKTINVDLAKHYAPTGASDFLRTPSTTEPVRYFGYGPRLQGNSRRIHYSKWFAAQNSNALLASNMATPLGLQSIQGYNAIQISRYEQFITALNGGSQNYHDADVFPSALDSRLLDLLNVRYIIVPTEVGSDQGSLQRFKKNHPTVYSDERVEIVENQDALPRAWIVHSAQKATPKEALKSLKTGKVDPRKTALLEGSIPKLAKPKDASDDLASVTSYEDDRISIRTSTDAAGLLVLSEVYYPAWKAYIDGEPAPIHRADQLLRAVPVPAGEHVVEMRYESSSLRAGVAISSVAIAVFFALAAARILRRRNREQR